MSQNSTFQARLIDVDNISDHPSLLISKPVFKIGRRPDSDFLINQGTVSGRHAAIEQKQDGYFIVDQNSTNKTWLNGIELEPNVPKQLSDGDEIHFDKFLFVFKLEQIEPSPPDPDPEEDEPVVFDSMSLMDTIKDVETSQSEVDIEETIFADFTEPPPILLKEEMAEFSPSAEEVTEPPPTTAGEVAESPPAATDSDEDELVFLDSDDLMAALDDVGSSRPETDEDETDFFGSNSMIEEITDEADEAHPDKPEPEEDETDFLDSSSLLEELQDKTDEAHPDKSEPEEDETIFFDSGSLLEELQDKTDEAHPDEPEPEEDETVFFDSGSLIDELNGVESSQPEIEEDETVFLDSGSLAEAEKGSVFKQEPDDAAEIKIIGNYEVTKLLGKGGFGSVWKAKTKHGQPIAIKVLNPEVLENERAVRKFFHEAINMAKMDHPNICSFIDFFPHEGNYAIVMDFVQGTDLQDLLKSQGGPLPFDTAVMIASQTLDGFHYAHLQNVLHRDIKPENITLTPEGVAKIMDFGIARLSSTESQQTSLFMISPAYTAPERFDASKTELVDHRADIYSLGLVFYELFTGKHPFPATSPTEMIMAHISKIPAPPDEIEDLPSEISEAILKALEKDPDDRFEDFADFKMAMLGEAPRMPDGRTQTAMTFYGEYCKGAAELLKTCAGILKKHQKKADKISIVQEGTQVHLIIEARGGNPVRITKDLAQIIGKK